MITKASSEFLSQPLMVLELLSMLRDQKMPHQSPRGYSIQIRKRQPQRLRCEKRVPARAARGQDRQSTNRRHRKALKKVDVAPEFGELATLKTIEPAGINAVAEDEWVEIEIAVDSGATETVMSGETLNGVIDITESATCKRGIVYEVADGTQIPNLGERKFFGIMDDGSAKGVATQVCAINKTLMSVSKITSKGNRVVFDDDGSFIESKATGERSWLTQSGGMYYLKMWGLAQKNC